MRLPNCFYSLTYFVLANQSHQFKPLHHALLPISDGAHLFHTGLERVYKYITKWQDKAPWKRYDHEVVGWLDGKLLPIPVNINTVNGLLEESITTPEEMDQWLKNVQVPCKKKDKCANAEEMAKSRVGKDLFEKVFATYTKKQWDKEPKELDALLTARIPVRNNFDPRYFSDKYQVLPSKGYTKWFAEVLNHKNIDVVLGVDYFKVRKSLEGRCGKTIFTGPIDRYFQDSKLGKLEYRSINFEAELLKNSGYYQTHSVVNYPGPEVDFTRIVEYKHYFHQKSDYTITVKEYSTDKGDPYYAVPNPKNHELYKKYQELAEKEEKEKNVYFVGRLASYNTSTWMRPSIMRWICLIPSRGRQLSLTSTMRLRVLARRRPAQREKNQPQQ